MTTLGAINTSTELGTPPFASGGGSAGDPFLVLPIKRTMFPYQTTSMWKVGHYGGNSDQPTIVDSTSSLGGQAAGGAYFQQDTAATTNSDAYVQVADGATVYSLWRVLLQGIRYQYVFSLQTTATVRCFVGITANASGGMVANDSYVLSFGYIGLQYSTSAGHTNWQIIHAATGTAPVRIDTGVAVSTNIVALELLTPFSATTQTNTWDVRLYDITAASEIYSGTITTDIPGHPSVPHTWDACAGVRTLATSVASFRHYRGIFAPYALAEVPAV